MEDATHRQKAKVKNRMIINFVLLILRNTLSEKEMLRMWADMWGKSVDEIK